LNTFDVTQQGPLVTSDPVSFFYCLLKFFKNGMEIEIDALVDSEATTSFIHVNFVQKYGLPIKLKNTPTQVEVIDSKTIESGIVTPKIKPLNLTIDSYVCKVAFNVIKSPNNFIILGQN
jgi:hypothetical protein